jgi:N-acetyl-gamma-glutamyl-phosphate reductase
MKTAIIGSTGYGGVELLRLLAGHPEMEVEMLVSTSQAGEPLMRVFPHLKHLSVTFEEMDMNKLAESVDLVFFATPAGISSRLAPVLAEQGKIVIDLSGDFRLGNPETYEKWYGKPAAPAEWLERAVYGLSEWFHDAVQTAQLIANPGCYPTATLLALIPLLKEKVIDPSTLIIDAKSGVSGAGRKAQTATLFGEVNENLRPYKVDGHQHIPEIERFAGLFAETGVKVNFVPHLVPMNRGILVTIYASLLNKYTNRDLYELYWESYRSRLFVRVLDEGWPQTKGVQGSNYCDIGFQVDERTGRVIVLAAIDNLVKGAAGQAVQNANIRLGLPECVGLELVPLYP